MEKLESSAAAVAAFEALGADLEGASVVVVGRMFGSTSLMLNKRPSLA